MTDAQGNQWQDGDIAVEGYELAVALCEGLPQGEYEVAYRVIYSDSHTGEERFSFTNADPDAPAHGAPENCGEATEQKTSATPETSEPSEAQDTLAADETATENSIPGWIWIAGGVGIIVIAGIVFLVLRGRPTDSASEDPSDD